MRFQGKTILVTGGAMGIGEATVRRFVQEGATVIVADCDEKAFEEGIGKLPVAGGQAIFQFVDLADPASIEQMGQAAAQHTPYLHGLVNNAGVVGPCFIKEIGQDDWSRIMDINLRAPLLCAKALLPLLKAGPGHIVNVSSEGGFRARAGHGVYDATKAGICSLTRTMACEFVEYGIRVNTVAPGWTVTEMHFLKADDPAARKAELEGIDYHGAIIRRLGHPDEIAAGIAFLLSDDASYITATTLHVDGGRVAH